MFLLSDVAFKWMALSKCLQSAGYKTQLVMAHSSQFAWCVMAVAVQGVKVDFSGNIMGYPYLYRVVILIGDVFACAQLNSQSNLNNSPI